MSRVKSKNTSIEIKFRKELWKRGYRYRLHAKMPGHPDIVLAKYKIAFFVDGCFWHGCQICKKTMPVSNEEYWRRKIDRNMERDRINDKLLKESGWNPIHVWEHQIRNEFEITVKRALESLSDNL